MHPAYVREKARDLRTQRHLSIDEIAERLALPKTTVYYWVRDLPLGRPRRATQGQRRGNRVMRTRYRLAREAAYAAGREEFATLARDVTFRHFVQPAEGTNAEVGARGAHSDRRRHAPTVSAPGVDGLRAPVLGLDSTRHGA